MHYSDTPYENRGRVLAFKLGGRAALPRAPTRPERPVDVPPIALEPERVERGQDPYSVHCARCHNFGAQSRGLLPDLRLSTRAVHESRYEIVLCGALRGKGMASFADQLDRDEVDAIHAYVISRALHEPTLVEEALAWAAKNVCLPATWIAD